MRNHELDTVGSRVAATLALLAGFSTIAAAQVDPQGFAVRERGHYLAEVADCASCHTNPDGGPPFAGGRTIETPFGNVVSANITPDRDTGIGAWTDEQFDAAVRGGRRPDGSRLYPAMPYNDFTRMSREDVLAIRAYLNTVTPVKNAVESDTLPFPYDMRGVMSVWDALYFSPNPYRSDPRQSAEWNRGAYLVEGPGHCGACHTPKSSLGGDEMDQYLKGARLQGWFAPDITNDAQQGVGDWSVPDLIEYLKTGHNRVAAASGPMAEVVALSSSHLRSTDLRAIAVYLKSLPGRQADPQPLAPANPVMVAGAAIYRDQCSACHGLKGQGTPELFPSIAGSSSVRAADPTTLIRVVLRGARSVATPDEPTAPGMPSYSWQLDDGEVAAVLTYIRNTWGAAAPAVSPEDVRRARDRLAVRRD